MTVKTADLRRYIINPETGKNVRKLSFIRNDFNHPRQITDRLGIASCITAHHDRTRSGISAMNLTNHLARTRIAVVRDRAGVDHAEIGRLVCQGFAIAVLQQSLSNQLRFVLIHLAAEGFEAAGSEIIHTETMSKTNFGNGKLRAVCGRSDRRHARDADSDQRSEDSQSLSRR